MFRILDGAGHPLEGAEVPEVRVGWLFCFQLYTFQMDKELAQRMYMPWILPYPFLTLLQILQYAAITNVRQYSV